MPFSVTADFKIDGVTNSQSLRFECNGKNIGNSLTLENVKPDVKELEVDGKTITVTVEDAYTGITSIEYGFEGLHWNPDPDIQKWEKSNSQEIEYIEYVNPNIDFTQHPNKLKIPIELNNVPSGNYNLCLRITDYAGNHLEWKSKEEGKNVQSDNDAPKIEVVNVIGDNESVFSNDIWYKNGNIKIKIRDGNGVPSFEIKDAEDKIFNRFNVEPEIENGNEIGKNIYIPISDLSDGEYDLKIWAKDGLENSVDIPTKIHFHVDKTKPEIQVSNEEWYGIEQQGKTIKITVDEENPLSSFTVEENDRTFDEFKNGNEINIPISMFQDGEHCLTINAEDVAGNPAEEKVIVFHVDTARPTIKVFDVVDGKEFSFTNDNENWYGIQQQGDSIRIEISERFSELTVMDETTNKSFKIENNKEYVIPISEFSENGEHRLKIDVVDMAENPNSEEIIFNVDTEAPVVTALKDREWDKRSFQISDKGSEIVNVKYSYDGKKWITKDLSEIENGILTLDALDEDKIRHNVVFVRATDKAGNTNNENGKVFEFPKDEQRPELESIEIYYDASKNDTPDWQPINEDVFHAYQYGNFTNKKIEIRVRAEDKPNENGIASGLNLELLSAGSVKYHEHYEKVESLDEDGNVLLDENGNVKYEEVFDSYAFTFEKVGEYKNVSIHLEDIAGNTNNIPLNFNSSEPQGEADYIIPEDLKTNYTTPIYQNSLIIDNTAPTGKYNKPKFGSSEDNQTKWYGIKQSGDNIVIQAKEQDSGIYSISVFDNDKCIREYVRENLDSRTFKISVFDNDKLIGENKKEVFGDAPDYDDDILIPIKEFKEGEHHLTVEIIDNAGNSNTFSMRSGDETVVKSLDFSTDFTAPKGKIKLNENSNSVEINGNNWFDWSDNIIFDFEIEDAHPNRVKWAMKKPNSQSDVPAEQSDFLSFSEPDENNKSVASLLPPAYDAQLDENGEHFYTVSAEFFDEAGNSNRDNDSDEESEIKPLTAYKDYEAPKIERVSVSKKENAFEQVLRILTFGIYSNDSVKVEVWASERVGDSRLGGNSVELSMGDVVDSAYVEDTTESTTETTDTTVNPTDATATTMDTTDSTDTTDTTENSNLVDKPKYMFMKLKNPEGEEFKDENEINRVRYEYELEFPSEKSELYQQLVNQVISGEISVRVTDLYQFEGKKQNINTVGEHIVSEFSQIFANGEQIKGAESTKSKFYMIEKIAPTITINVPDGDGKKRED